MKRYTTLIFLSVFISSCSLFRFEKVSQNIPIEAQKICLNSEGKGRIELPQGKYVFSYESAVLEEDGKFIMVLNFPIYGEEKFEINFLDINAKENNSELEHRLLATGDGVNPVLVQNFISIWASYFRELIAIKNKGKLPSAQSLNWKVLDQKLIATALESGLEFYSSASVANKDFFEHLTFEMKEKGLKVSEGLKVELFVRECLEKTE